MSVVSKTADAAGSRRREAERDFLNATEALLEAGESFIDLPIERIALEAGRTRTAFYLYFSTKKDLLQSLAENVTAELYAQAERWWAALDGRDALRPAIETVMGTWVNHSALLRAVVEYASIDPQIHKFWLELVQRFIEPTCRKLEAEGHAPREAKARAVTLVWMTERLCYLQSAREADLADDQAIDALVEVWHGAVYG